MPNLGYKFTHFQFRRFAGCPICNVHLQNFAANAEEISERGIQEVVFFHSTEKALRTFNAKLPFHLIADPDKRHYRAFGVEASLIGVLRPKAMWTGLRGVLRKGLGLSLKNGPLGLPADFLIDDTNIIVAAKYGTHAYDQWSIEELFEKVAAASKNQTTQQPAETCP